MKKKNLYYGRTSSAFTRQNYSGISGGFTIVELLVVIAVIGVLAAITVVAYSNITQKATVVSLQSDLSNAANKLKTFQATYDSFPATIDCTQADSATNQCIKSSSGTTYQYLVDNSTSVPTFCITATNGAVNYKVDSNSSPASGSCSITNLATNPSFESGTTAGMFVNTTIASNQTILSDSSKYGTKILRQTLSTSGSAGNFGIYTQLTGLTTGAQYTLSTWVRASKSMSFYLGAEERSSNDVYLTGISGPLVTLTANTWTRLSLTYTLVSGATKTTFCTYSGTVSWAVGDTVDFDGLMATQGSTLYNYADGNSSNWAWSGTANLSTSTGPAL